MKNLKRILSFFIVMGFMFVMLGFRVAAVATSKTVTYTVTSKTAVSESGYGNGTSATYTQTYGTACQATSGNSFTLTVTFDYDSTITGLVLSMKSNSKGGAGSLSATISGSKTATIASIEESAFNTASWNGKYTTSYVDVTPTVTSTAVEAGDKLTIHIAATVNSLYCESYSITYTADIPSNPSVSITAPTNQNLMVGNTLQLESSYFDIDNPTPDEWASSNTNAATVSSTGLVTPVGLGTTNITRTVGGTASNAIALKIWPSNTSNISVATALAIAEFAGSSNSPYSYSSAGTVSEVIDANNFTLFDGNDSITVYMQSHGFRTNDSVVVNGKLKKYNSTLEYSNPTATGYTVTFNTDGGTPSYDTITGLASGAKISDPGSPTKTGYSFTGWYNGDAKWNFDTNTVTSSIVLTAKWASNTVPTPITNALESTNAYMSLAYAYTLNKVDNPTTYTKATSISHLSAGDSIIIVSKMSDGTYYAMTNSLSSNTLAKSAAITIEDGVITSDISSNFVWTLYGNTTSGWDLKNGDNFINPASGTGIGFANSENHKLTFVSSGNNSYFLNNGTRTMICGSSGFKNYATSNIGGSGYAVEVYIFVKQATAKYTVRDVDFRIRCAIDEGLAVLNEDYAITFGIEVTAGGKTVRYSNSDGAAFQTSGGKQFVTLDLGDMLNTNYANLDTEFTVKAYVGYDGGIIYSTNEKTYSVKGMVNQYYNVEHIDAVEGLKEILESYGYTFE